MKKVLLRLGVFLSVTIVIHVVIQAMVASSILYFQKKQISFFSVLQFKLPAFFLVLIYTMAVLLTLVIYLKARGHSGIDKKARVAGDGQHGTAAWLSDKEVIEAFKIAKVMDEWDHAGFIVGHVKDSYIVDTGEVNCAIFGPPGYGKSRRLIIPTIIKNARIVDPKNKPSMIISDAKGDLWHKTASELIKQGYRVLKLDFRNPQQSNNYNLLHVVNSYADLEKTAKTYNDKVHYTSLKEKYAKILAESIVKQVKSESSSETSEFFTTTAQGLITALILLVSEYGYANERHILSVFQLITDLNGLAEGSTETLQKNRLSELFQKLPESDHRAKLFASAAITADVRTSMNVFSSALQKLMPMIDLELEQIICRHDDEFDVKKFIEKPTAIFLVVPDEDTTKHFLASLFLRSYNTMLIQEAEANGGTLPCLVLNIWDEFGQLTVIKDLTSLFSAARSRAIRFMVALQANAQLDAVYGKELAKILKATIQTVLFTATTALDLATAEMLEKVLGAYTTTAQNVSAGSSNSGVYSSSTSYNQSESLMKRSLMTADEISRIPQFTYVVKKSGFNPYKSKLPDFASVIQASDDQVNIFNEYTQIVKLTDKIFSARLDATSDVIRLDESTDYAFEQSIFSDEEDNQDGVKTLNNRAIQFLKNIENLHGLSNLVKLYQDGQTDTLFRILSEHTQKNEMSAQYAIDFATILQSEGSDLQKSNVLML